MKKDREVRKQRKQMMYALYPHYKSHKRMTAFFIISLIIFIGYLFYVTVSSSDSTPLNHQKTITVIIVAIIWFIALLGYIITYSQYQDDKKQLLNATINREIERRKDDRFDSLITSINSDPNKKLTYSNRETGTITYRNKTTKESVKLQAYVGYNAKVERSRKSS